MTRQLSVAAVTLLAVLLSGSLLSSRQRSFSSTTLGVRVDVLVTEGRNTVGGLRAADFELRDNGVLQTVDVVDSSDVALNAVLDGLQPVDRAALTTFSHAVAPRIALTSDLSAVRRELRRIMPSGETAMMDGVYVALTTTLAQSGRSLLVVCTDGADTSSWLEPDEVLESAKRSNAVIYAVTAAETRRHSPLKDLTDATGGQLLQIASSADLRGAFQKILRDFRSRYVLTYTPAGVPTGGFHRLDVRVKRPRLTVKARPGYIGVGPAR
jgi:VWFA-related protein